MYERPSHSPPFILLFPLSYPLVFPPLIYSPLLPPLSSPLLPSSLSTPSLSPLLFSPHSPLPFLHYRAESLREDSEVKSIFGGQLRSKIVCPDCAKVTVYFEYFRSVSNNTRLSHYHHLTTHFYHFEY